MARVRLLHLSDLHVALRLLRMRSSRFEAHIHHEAVRFVLGLGQQGIDAVLLGGDLGNSGWKEDLDEAKKYVTGPWPPGGIAWPSMSQVGKPLLMLPGNHDRFVAPWLATPGNREFDRVFNPTWTSGRGGVQTFLLPGDDQPLLALVCADFTLAHEHDASHHAGHWGQGRVYPAVLKKLVAETVRCRALPTAPAVAWVVHFAPEFPNLSSTLQLIDEHDLTKAAAQNGIKYIFCGHTHIVGHGPSPTQPAVTIVCAGSVSCVNSGIDTSLHVLDFDVDAGQIQRLARLDFYWQPGATPGTGTFVQKHSKPPWP